MAKLLAQFGNMDASRSQIVLQIANLAALQQKVGVSSNADLQRIQSEANATIATAQSMADTAGNNDARSAPSVADASAESRHAVQGFLDDYYNKRKFDQYLVFSSDEDERAFREREKKRRQEIEQAMAEGTPEGTLRANKLAAEQLRDAGAHGADKSPDYQPELKKLDNASDQLDTAIIAASAKPALPPQAEKHVAALKNAGVTVADQSGDGHGVKIDASIAQLLGRG